MRGIYLVLRNFLVFFFLVSIFNGVSIIQGLIGTILVGIIFGILMMLVPAILAFFKIKPNFWSTLLLGIIVAFIFFFLMRMGFLGIGTIGSTEINWGAPGLGVLRMDDLTTLVVISLVSALATVGMEALSGDK